MDVMRDKNDINLENETIQDKLIWILSSLMIASFNIYETASYGKYIMLAISAAVLFLTASKNFGKITIRLEAFHYWIAAFSLFCFMSAVWAISPKDAVSKGITIFELLACISCFYLYYRDYGGINKLLKSIMWAGYIVMAYTVVFYGASEILRLLSTSQRLASDYSNSNSVGMIMMYSLIITIYYWLFDSFKPIRLIVIPEIVMIAVTGSRKALVGTVLGVALIYLYRLLRERNVRSFLKSIVFLGVVVIILRILADKNVFALVLYRMESILNEMFGIGSGYVDNSTLARESMKTLGVSIFKSNPVVGIGMGNAYIYNSSQLGMEAYLHDNYVELLASGGIVGFLIYYGFYAYVAIEFLKNRFIRHPDMTLIMIFLLIMLIMDYGAVSYYSKTTYMFRMLMALGVLEIKRRRLYAE